MAPALASWVPVPEGCDWTIHNIPFGIFSTLTNTTPRPGTAIGEHVRGQNSARNTRRFPATCTLVAGRGLLARVVRPSKLAPPSSTM